MSLATCTVVSHRLGDRERACCFAAIILDCGVFELLVGKNSPCYFYVP